LITDFLPPRLLFWSFRANGYGIWGAGDQDGASEALELYTYSASYCVA
jgi:hypothetical protein